MHTCMQVPTEALELEFEATVNHLMCIPEARASARVAGSLNHQAVSPAQFEFFEAFPHSPDQLGTVAVLSHPPKHWNYSSAPPCLANLFMCAQCMYGDVLICV